MIRERQTKKRGDRQEVMEVNVLNLLIFHFPFMSNGQLNADSCKVFYLYYKLFIRHFWRQ